MSNAQDMGISQPEAWELLRRFVQHGPMGGGYTGPVTVHCKNGVIKVMELSTKIKMEDLQSDQEQLITEVENHG